jgi:hypothetical protein
MRLKTRIPSLVVLQQLPPRCLSSHTYAPRVMQVQENNAREGGEESLDKQNANWM